MPTYYTHYNNGRPFEVEINDNLVRIGVELHDGSADYQQIMTLKVEQVWISQEWPGSSLLFCIAPLIYLWIGHIMIEFQPEAEIVEFHSPHQNSDCFEAWARDLQNNTYLMTNFVKLTHWTGDDPAQWFYDHALITADHGFIPPKSSLHSNSMDMVALYVGNSRSTCRWTGRPDAEYDRLSKIGVISFDNSKGERKPMDQTQFKALMEAWATECGWERFEPRIFVPPSYAWLACAFCGY